MGRALLGALVVMGEDAEAQFRVLEEDLALRNVVAEVLGHERVVGQDALEEGAHLLAPRGSRRFLEKSMTLGCELLEGMPHGPILRRRSRVAPGGSRVRIAPRAARRRAPAKDLQFPA